MPVYDARARRAPGEPFRPSLEMIFRGHRQGVYGLSLQPGRELHGRRNVEQHEQKQTQDKGGDYQRNQNCTQSREQSEEGRCRVGRGCVSPIPPKVLSAGADGTVMLWDANPTTRALRFRGHHGPVYGCAFGPSPGGSSSSLFASCGHDGYVRLWVTQARRAYASSLAMHSIEEVCDGIGARSSNSNHYTYSRRSRNEESIHTPTARLGGEDSAAWKAHTGASRALCFAQDGSDHLYTVGDDKGVKCWDVCSGCTTPASTLWRRSDSHPHCMQSHSYYGNGCSRSRFMGSFGSGVTSTGHTNWLRCLAVQHPAHCATFSHYLASGGDDHSVHVWDTRTRAAVHVFYEPTASVRAVSFHPDGHSLACADAGGAINVFDLRRSSQEMYPSRSSSSSSNSNNRNKSVAIAASQRYGALLQHYRDAHVGTVNALSFAPNGGWLLSAGEDGAVRLWDVKEGFLYCAVQAHEAPVRACCFSSDGDFFATAGLDKVVMLWRSGFPRSPVTTTTTTTAAHAMTAGTGAATMVRVPSATCTSSVRFVMDDIEYSTTDGSTNPRRSTVRDTDDAHNGLQKLIVDHSLPNVSQDSVSQKAATLMTNPTSCSYNTMANSLGSDVSYSVDNCMCRDPSPHDTNAKSYNDRHDTSSNSADHNKNDKDNIDAEVDETTGMTVIEERTEQPPGWTWTSADCCAVASATPHPGYSRNDGGRTHADTLVSEKMDVAENDMSVIDCDGHTASSVHMGSDGDLTERLACLERAVTSLTELVRKQQHMHATELAAVQDATKAEQAQHKRDIADLRDMMRTLIQQQTILARHLTGNDGLGE